MNEFCQLYPKMDNKNEKSQINQKQYSKTPLCTLSKVAEQTKIHLICIVWKGCVYDRKFYLVKPKFLKSCDLTPL
jgi:hypothetical protein